MNNVPRSRGPLRVLATKIKVGLDALGVILGITQMPPETFEDDQTAFNNSWSGYNAARSAQQVKSNAYKSACAGVSVFLKSSRATLVASFGPSWNTMWAQAGFVQPSTAVPRRLADRLSLATSLVKFLTDNPSYEVASKGVTAAIGQAALTAVTAAEVALQPAKAATAAAKGVLGGAQQVLVTACRTVIKVLSTALGPNDPRWKTFGLNPPGADVTPAAPTGLSASMSEQGVLLSCADTALATRYRFRGKFVGVDTAYKLLASSPIPMAVVKDVAPGATMEIIVQAVNNGAQGVPSDPITYVVPPVAAAAKPANSEEELAPLAAISPNGNGNGSTNGNGNRRSARVS